MMTRMSSFHAGHPPRATQPRDCQAHRRQPADRDHVAEKAAIAPCSQEASSVAYLVIPKRQHADAALSLELSPLQLFDRRAL
jgi:hypothetical protein